METYKEPYKWSTMSGKLKGIPALNTDTTSNKYCQVMSKREDTICFQCYSYEMLQTFRKNCVPRFKKNSEYLSYKIHAPEYLPKVASNIARFNGHGELVNKKHLENLFRICENQPKTTFTLWTKKKEWVISALNKRPKPKNLILVYSNKYIDTVVDLPKYFDKTFNNVSFDSDKINCHRKCVECMMCYDLTDKTTIIVEKVK